MQKQEAGGREAGVAVTGLPRIRRITVLSHLPHPWSSPVKQEGENSSTTSDLTPPHRREPLQENPLPPPPTTGTERTEKGHNIRLLRLHTEKLSTGASKHCTDYSTKVVKLFLRGCLLCLVHAPWWGPCLTTASQMQDPSQAAQALSCPQFCNRTPKCETPRNT